MQHQAATHDFLTGLYNRRYLDEFFQREAARALREQAPIAVVMLDLDHFKVLNDTYGHPLGDEVLCNLAGFLRGRLRESDAVFRLGGEEFLLILPGVATDEALGLVSRIGQELAGQPLPSRRGPLSITFSAGLVEYPRQAASLDQLLALADQALYRAKHAGRNRVCSVA
ncbi:Diguanylate cyclase DosC [compost metagenome]